MLPSVVLACAFVRSFYVSDVVTWGTRRVVDEHGASTNVSRMGELETLRLIESNHGRLIERFVSIQIGRGRILITRINAYATEVEARTGAVRQMRGTSSDEYDRLIWSTNHHPFAPRMALPQTSIFLGFGAKFADGKYPSFRTGATEILLPFWFLWLITLPPWIWFYRVVRGECRTRTGRCPACGYDLRATTDRCPECGETKAKTS